MGCFVFVFVNQHGPFLWITSSLCQHPTISTHNYCVLGLYFVNNDTALWKADHNLEFLLSPQICVFCKHNMNIYLCRFTDHTFINVWDCYTLVITDIFQSKRLSRYKHLASQICAFDIELFKLYRCLTGNLSTLCRDFYPFYLQISVSSSLCSKIT